MEELETIFSFLTVVSNILIIFFLVTFLFFRKSKLNMFFKEYSLEVAFIISFFATSGSLIFSDILNFEPCTLCWYQRIFMFTIPLMLFFAIHRKENNIWFYSFVFSIIWGGIAFYQYLMQFFNAPIVCSPDSWVSCSDIVSLWYWYVTIPLMSLSAFILIWIFSFISFKK